MFLHEPYMSFSYAWRKKYVFDYFEAFSIVFDHANSCECMRKHVIAGRNTQQVDLILQPAVVAWCVYSSLKFK